MPVPFDPSLLSFSKCQIKSVTTALGGACRVVTPDSDHRGFRVPVPFHLSRSYIKREKSGEYMSPKHSEIIMYDGNPICFEAFPYKAHFSDTMEVLQKNISKWKSRARRALDRSIVPHIESDDVIKWYIDGYVIYGLPDKELWEEDSTPLNTAGTFRRMRVPVFKLSDLSDIQTDINRPENLMVERDCLVYRAPDNNLYITPPIWTNLGQIGSRKLDIAGGDNIDHELFDNIDSQLNVNISFALETASRLTSLFGYASVEALQLPELMIEYRTLNLSKLPNAVKQTAPCGIQFTHVLSWLMGLFKDPDTLASMLEFRAVLKYLTQKGLQVGDVMSDELIFRDGYTSKDIGLLSFKEIEMIRTGNTGSMLEHVA